MIITLLIAALAFFLMINLVKKIAFTAIDVMNAIDDRKAERKNQFLPITVHHQK